jgi:hypothetical protein
MLIHLPIIILTSLHPIPIADAVFGSAPDQLNAIASRAPEPTIGNSYFHPNNK